MRTPEMATLSMRLRAEESSRASTPSSFDSRGGEGVNETSAAQRAFVVSDAGSRRSDENPVCRDCAEQLRPTQLSRVSPVALRSGCKLCAAAAGKPETFTQPFCDFLTDNPTVFHAVEYFKGKLAEAGFEEVRGCPRPFSRQDGQPSIRRRGGS